MKVQTAPEFSLGKTILRLFVSLLIVIACFYLIFFVLKRTLFRESLHQDTGVIRVALKVALDGRKVIYLVEIANRFLVVGGGEHELSLIAEINEKDAVQEIRDRLREQNKIPFREILSGGKTQTGTRGRWGDTYRILRQSNTTLKEKIERLRHPDQTPSPDGRPDHPKKE